MDRNMMFLLIMAIPAVTGFKPGLYYWKPRLGIDLAIPTTVPSMTIYKPSKENVREGMVVLLNGYQAGVTIIALAAGASSGGTYPHLSPLSAYFYTNSYRWGLRYFSLIPFWLGGHSGNFCETVRVWRRRFFYMDEFLPKWARKIFPFVDKDEWEKEEWEWKRFKKYAEPAFGKHYRYPSKSFRDYRSQITQETPENFDSNTIGN